MDPTVPNSPTPNPAAPTPLPVDPNLATAPSDPTVLPDTTPAPVAPVPPPPFDAAPAFPPAPPAPASADGLPSEFAPASAPVATDFAATSVVPTGTGFGDQAIPAPPTPPPAPLPGNLDSMQMPSAPAMDTPMPTPEVAAAPAADNPFPETSVMPDSAPTDLSHLAYNNGGSEAAAVPTAETLVVPQVPQETAAVSGGGSRSFPKWILIAGVLILLMVAAGSAYFILGIGRTGLLGTSSVPAEQQPLANPPKQIIPTQPVVTPVSATPSAGFGSLQGATPSAQTSTSSGKPASALELLRQRQGTQ